MSAVASLPNVAPLHEGSKRYRAAAAAVDGAGPTLLPDAFVLLKKICTAKFDETVDLAIRLGIDPKQTDQTVRGTVLLPHGTGQSRRVLVFAKGEKEREAQAAGADFVGSDDLIAKINGGWTDFDVAVAAPDLMREVGKLGKVLGPRGLMPNPKTGTVTNDVAKVVRELKAGRIEFKSNAQAIVHTIVGKASFAADKLSENAHAILEAVLRAKPAAAKGTYIKSIAISPTMGPAVRIDPARLGV